MDSNRNRLTLLIVFEVAACALLCSVISVVAFYATLSPDTFSFGATTAAPTTQPPPKIVVATPTILVTRTNVPTPAAFNYKVVTGDTLWGIAAKFNITLAEIITANPSINPDKLLVGQTLIIPASERQPDIVPSTESSYVAPEVSALRLRRGPSESDSVIMMLAPNTAVRITGRTSDSKWLEVITTNNQRGWVSAQWIRTQLNIANVPISTPQAIVLVPTFTPSPRPTINPNATATPTAQPNSGGVFISGITDTSRQIYASGRKLGNRPGVFSKIGDSITFTGTFLHGFGLNKYNLQSYQAELEPVVKFYNQEVARDGNSFSNNSLAAEIGWSSQSMVTLGNGHKELCTPQEIPLACEYRYTRPAVAIIMLGTNDVPGIQPTAFERNMRRIIEMSTERGIIPILSTIPPMLNRDDANRVPIFNAIIKALAREYDIPLVDLWAALQPLPSYGLTTDGVHLTYVPPYSTDLTTENLKFGMTMRNLTTLQALDAIWRNVLR